jgi:thiamine biosynthesis lipoprotein
VTLVALADDISRASGGRYDITVGPLINLWGFGNQGAADKAPAAAAIRQTLARVGYRHLAFRQDPPALKKAIPGLEIDLSSIAKGWAVDELAGLLEAYGIINYLVEIGGELRGAGRNASGRPWRIALEKPLRNARAVQRLIEIDGEALATSGDYRNFFRDGEHYYSHTIDPISGYALQQRLASVTVLTDRGAIADGWATALLALGEEDAPALAEHLGLKALFVVRIDDGFRELATSAFATMTEVEQSL